MGELAADVLTTLDVVDVGFAFAALVVLCDTAMLEDTEVLESTDAEELYVQLLDRLVEGAEVLDGEPEIPVDMRLAAYTTTPAGCCIGYAAAGL